MTLREVFTPLIAYVLLVTRTRAERGRTSSEIRAAIVDRFLREQQELVKRCDLSVADYENALFAVIAWADEAIVRYASATRNLELYESWQRTPLQVQLHKGAVGGVEFFSQLNRLDTKQKEVREIYYLCLSLGFRGSHYSDSPEALLDLRRTYSQTLPFVPTDVYQLEQKRERLTPQPYEIPPLPDQRRRKPISLVWPSVAAAFVSLLLLYVLWPSSPCGNGKLDLGEQCDLSAVQCPGGLPCQKNCTCPPIPQPNMAEIERLTKGLECALVSAQNKNGIITLDGRVQSEDQKQQLVQTVRNVQNVTDVRSNLTLLEWPFCRVQEVLTPFYTQTKNSGASLSISLQHGCDQVYHSEERLNFAVTSSKELQYIYVDYYAADKNFVTHIAPNKEINQKNFYPKAKALTPGRKNGDDPSSDPNWKISEPFGQELATIVTSPQPLFTPQRQDVEKDITAYLKELEQKLKSASSPTEISAAFCFITSKE